MIDSNINKAHACIQNVLLQSREYEQTRRQWREESKTETQLNYPPLLLLVVLDVHGYLTENVMRKCAMSSLHALPVYTARKKVVLSKDFTLEPALKLLWFRGDSMLLSCQSKAKLQKKCCVLMWNLAPSHQPHPGCFWCRDVCTHPNWEAGFLCSTGMFNFWLYCLVVVQTTKMQIIKVSEVKAGSKSIPAESTLNTYGQTAVCCVTVLMHDHAVRAASPVISCIAEVSVAARRPRTVCCPVGGASCRGLTERQPWCH